MESVANLFGEARTVAGLSVEQMARLADVEVGRVRALESGAARSTPTDLDAYARAFGLPVDAFLRGAAPTTPLARLFLRSTMEMEGPDVGIDDLADADTQQTIGEFARCVHFVARLRSLLHQDEGPRLPSLSWQPASTPPFGADEAARRFREAMGLGLGPIESMRKLLDDLRVPAFWVTPEILSPTIDAASIAWPQPAVLINLVEGPRCWWRTRMTIAHELAHLLIDHHIGEDDIALVSPSAETSPRRFRLFDGFERIEQRAGAFAAHLLVPAESLRDAVRRMDPTSEAAVTKVCKVFWVGRTTAINRLNHEYQFGEAIRKRMLHRTGNTHDPIHPDTVPADEIGLHGGVVRALAIEALKQRRIDRVQVREFLDLPLTEPIPSEQLPAELRAPLRSFEDNVRSVAFDHLRHELGRDDLTPSEVAPAQGGWRVQLKWCGQAADRNRAPVLRVSYDCRQVDWFSSQAE